MTERNAQPGKDDWALRRKMETAATQVSIRQTAHTYPPKTDEDYARLTGAYLPEGCPGDYRGSSPCGDCPARVDCNPSGNPKKARIEHGTTNK